MFPSVSASAVGMRVAVGGSGVGVFVGVDEGDGGGIEVEVDGGGVAVTTKAVDAGIAGVGMGVEGTATAVAWPPNEMVMSQASKIIVTSRRTKIQSTCAWFFIFPSSPQKIKTACTIKAAVTRRVVRTLTTIPNSDDATNRTSSVIPLPVV